MKLRALTLIAILLLAGCAEKPITPPQTITLSPVTYDNLQGWNDDDQSEAVGAFVRSCDTLLKKTPDATLGLAGRARDWQPVCQTLSTNPPANDDEARRFFETWFTPYAVNDEAKGLFTGYYEAELNGAWQQGGPYQTPLWQRPNDLITVDLGDFHHDLKGRRVTGKVVGRTLHPYDDRAAIAQGSLHKGRAEPLLWVDDPIGAFFLEIQGSGRVQMADGSSLRVGYEAQNGKAYVALGRVMLDEGQLDRPVTMAKIRAWLRAHPDRAQIMMNRNPSAVFFRRLDGDGPVGAQGVVLTPRRSLAVDTSFVPLGVPLWLDLEPDSNGVTLSPRLVVAQDTGGAIKGPVRGDFFWGAGQEAETNAGMMQNTGTYYVLLPKTVSIHDNGR